MKKEFVGVGEDGEPLYLEKIHSSCFFVHAEGNLLSPFEFEEEKDAREFAHMLSKIRLKKRIEIEFME